ncbi:MAG: class I SAM-dependent methyltransferase [Anaerolineae bacterium]|nr:class I SAM-dependent methyltransferase [Anaerolineae bacterium]
MHGLHHHPQPPAPANRAANTQGHVIRWAHVYDWTVRLLTMGHEKSLREKTIQQAGIRPGDTVLDVGCGTGTLTLLAKATTGETGQVMGIDPSPEMIAVAQRKAAEQHCDVRLQTGVIESLPFPDGTFDVILSSLMFHHLPDDLKVRGLAEIYRTLKPGGHVLIVDIRRPVALREHLSFLALVHQGLKMGTDELVPYLRAAGYEDIQAGRLTRGALGYVQGRRGQ